MPDRPPPLLVVPGRFRYHEVTLNLWAAVMGVMYVIGAPPPTSLAAALPGGWRIAWAAGLAVGGALALVGSYWLSDVERGLELERAGLVTLIGALLVYVFAVVAAVGWPGLMAGGITSAWVWANGMRAVQITRDLLHIRQRLTP